MLISVCRGMPWAARNVSHDGNFFFWSFSIRVCNDSNGQCLPGRLVWQNTIYQTGIGTSCNSGWGHDPPLPLYTPPIPTPPPALTHPARWMAGYGAFYVINKLFLGWPLFGSWTKRHLKPTHHWHTLTYYTGGVGGWVGRWGRCYNRFTGISILSAARWWWYYALGRHGENMLQCVPRRMNGRTWVWPRPQECNVIRIRTELGGSAPHSQTCFKVPAPGLDTIQNDD